ncbi:uncharacterized protein JN550_005338 [Neoarthrinium moseri]|uniref:uncharacterized protein n=1 Tax=Neoarthrinium moseri TaxID=1658444 RepID=UPI001FDD94B6|nr:uncharacterized protein JN550_005338 [Neoarthrinium moseri]KAI1870410.1 hypothetical protein JN550_005338 [Neoarthrinium moseri]
MFSNPLLLWLLHLLPVGASPINAAFNLTLSALSPPGLLNLKDRALPTGTCNAQTPCENAACCGGNNNNLCGYSPGECGTGNCTSNCDAKAECGQYGKEGKQQCPLGVCCSQFGFCGSTSEFCDKGCQSDFGGCGDVKRPSCSGNSIGKRTVGYYEAWSNTRKCQSVSPEDLNLNGFTHINFAFAFFDPASFAIAPMDGKTGELYSRFTALKDKYSGLETWISVGGWSFTDPGPTRTAFSDMTSKASNRKAFIQGLISFMEHYGFTGVDLDWEYPQADDRGGVTADTANYVSLVKELREAFGTRYGISMTLPTSYWYLQHFDLANIQPHIDWFSLMAYDLHGTWDAQSKFVGPYLAPHTNVTEIDLGLDLLWRAGVKPEKVILGMGWYGRSFTLVDGSCNEPNGVCQFNGGAEAGECSNASGILDLQEIEDIISYNDLKPVWDKKAAVKWITWNDNQWVSYDDEDTFDQKRKFANSRCLGGTMVWAIDQRDQGADNGLAPAPGITTGDQQDAKQMSDDLAAGVTCYSTGCGESCKEGTNEVAQMNGQPGMLSAKDRCPANKYRSLCCQDGTTMGTCQWRGYRGVGLSCMGGCDDGETEVVQDTNHRDKKGDQTCTGGIQSYCCKDFRPAPTKEELADRAKEAAEEAAEAAAEQAALDIAAKVFCRVAVPALLAPLELIEAAIPIIGEILDIAEIAATPALIQLCVKGVEKEGKAVFKVFGKEHSITWDKPSKKADRPPKTNSKPNTSSCPANAKRADNAGGCRKRKRTVSMTKVTTEIAMAPHDMGVINCNQWAQPCLNYRSIINHYQQYETITCPYKRGGKDRPVVAQFNRERNTMAWDGIIGVADTCSPDEFPPAVLAPFNDGYGDLTSMADKWPAARAKMSARPPTVAGQMVRYINSKSNSAAGKIFDKCRNVPAYEVGHTATSEQDPGGDNPPTEWHFSQITYHRSAFTLNFAGLNIPADDGIPDNECVPTVNGRRRPGYALLNGDQWFGANQAEAQVTQYWPGGPAAFPANAKREWDEQVGLIVVGLNDTRRASPEELRDLLGFEECQDDACSREIEALRALARSVSPASGGENELPHVSLAEPTPRSDCGLFYNVEAFLERLTQTRLAGLCENPTGYGAIACDNLPTCEFYWAVAVALFLWYAPDVLIWACDTYVHLSRRSHRPA